MSIIKKILIISIILTLCLPLMCNLIYAHNVELETENIISFPYFIMGGSGTITVKDTITNYSLYFQAIAISDEVYAEIQKTKPNSNEQLIALKAEYEALKSELDDIDVRVKAAKTELETLLSQDPNSSTLEQIRKKVTDATAEFETKRTQYNEKIGEYNNKLKELQNREKELTPGYDDSKWQKLTDNKFQIDLTSFEGNVAHAVWIKLVTSDNKTYYDEATYELNGTKTPTGSSSTSGGSSSTPSSDPDKGGKKLNTKLYVVKDQSETKYLENDQGYITKKIVDSDPDKGEVTIELKLVNKGQETVKKKDTEIFLVVDNSPSMDFTTATGSTRKEIVLNAANQLVDSVYNLGNNIKIGLIDFHGNTLFESAGINNATVKQKLTNNKEELKTAINNLLESSTSSGTNIDAGLQRAEKNFTADSDCNKVIILLTDGIPNCDVQGNHTGNDVTTDEARVIQESTKQTLINLKNKGIYTITMLTGMDASDGNTDKNGTVYTGSNVEDELQAAERIFGTEQNPVADKYYLVKSANVNNIITEEIFNDVTKKINDPLNEVKIVDYFPSDITENFEFSYVGNPSKGTSSDAIDSTNKTITWNIGTLGNEEEATLKYKLKIKDMQNGQLLEKTISTNDKVVLTYKDKENRDFEVLLNSSPQIKLSEKGIDDPVVTPPGGDPTIAPFSVLPNTGLGIILMGCIALVLICGIGGLAKYHKLKDVKLK